MRVLGDDEARWRRRSYSYYRHTAQHSNSLGRIQQLWDEWEMQCLVLTSLALQAFLLFSAGLRKRNSSGAIRLLLWLAYLLADSLAVFVLGHLTLHVVATGGGTVHQLVLFWAPFLLLHLGGQETITAFSMEDNALWKRHLLSLVSQEALAVYVVAGKSWRGDDELLLIASTALMFVSGTVKYAERTYALKGANAMALRNKFTATPLLLDEPILSRDGVGMLSGYFNWMEIDKNNYAQLVRKAYDFFGLYMNLLMDMPRSWLSDDYGSMPDACRKLQSNPDRACKSYKLVELQLSLIYDYLYTKIGMRHCHLNPLLGAALQAVTFISTSAALVLFVMVDHDYSRADVVVSYVLLIGAVVLEVSSAMILVSSYWTYCGVHEFCIAKGIDSSGSGAADVIFGLVKCVRPASRQLWSGKLARYDLIRGCIQEKQASVVGRAIRWIGVDCDTTHVDVSGDLKELVLDKLIGIGANWMGQKDFVRFRGERALADRLRSGGMTTTVLHDSVSNVDFPTSVLVWHVATDICFFSGGDDEHPPPHRGPSKELSDYLMYLVAKCDVLRSSSSRFSLDKALNGVLAGCKGKGAGQDYRRRHAREMLESEKYDGDQSTLLASREVARCLVRNFEDPAERWDLIAAVWVEMLCYLAPRCTAKFHATHLSTGGEFVTHVRILMINLGLAWEIRPNW